MNEEFDAVDETFSSGMDYYDESISDRVIHNILGDSPNMDYEEKIQEIINY